MLIFVYGTLLRGRANHYRYLSEAEYIGEGTISGYTLYDLGGYPGIKRTGQGLVKGEVYQVDEKTLAAIDHLEDEGDLYTRVKATVACNSRQYPDVWTYLYNWSVADYRSVHYNLQPWKQKV